MMKKQILDSVLEQLEEECRFLRQAAKAAEEAATSEESKPENEYDTRALEASYLAQAQGKRLQELQKMMEHLKSFPTRENPGSLIASGSLVQVDSEGNTLWYFLLPWGAGLQAIANNEKITVVSLDSPLGLALQGKKAGDIFTFSRPKGSREYEILQVL